jgi:hypothetical protein
VKKKAKKNAKKNAKKSKPTTTTSTATTTTTLVSATPMVSASNSAPPSHITPTHKAKAAANDKISDTTITGKHGTVTIHVTTIAAEPECTCPGAFKKLFKHKKSCSLEEEDDLFA